MISRPVLVDTCALADKATPVLCNMGFFAEVVVLESVRREILGFRSHPQQQKQQVGHLAACTLLELQSLPDVKVIMDTQEPTDSHPDRDLLNRAQVLGACILTADSGLHTRAEARGIDTLFLPEIHFRLRLITPTLAKMFQPLREVSVSEILTVQIVKRGRGADQGVGYLEDRRKVVIKGGSSYLGKQLEVRVYHIHQPSPGYEILFAVPTAMAAVA